MDNQDMINAMAPEVGEDKEDYLYRLGTMKKDRMLKITWEDISDIMLDHYLDARTGDAWRRVFNRIHGNRKLALPLEDAEGFKRRVILADSMNYEKQQHRLDARVKELEMISKIVAEEFNKTRPLQKPTKIKLKAQKKEAILCIGDWHYGLVADTKTNTYDVNVCRDRANELKCRVEDIIKKEGIKKLHLINLGDMISGLIHGALRFNASVGVMGQVSGVTEILSDLINDLSKVATIDYYYTIDNHSRLDSNKSDSLSADQLSHTISEMLMWRLQTNPNVTIHLDNPVSSCIATFNVFNHKVAAVHGDKDKPGKAIAGVNSYIQEHVDLLLSAHLHHFSANEENYTLHIANGSLMGTDEYAEGLRLSSPPSQNLIIATPDNVCECLYKINLTSGTKKSVSVFNN